MQEWHSLSQKLPGEREVVIVYAALGIDLKEQLAYAYLLHDANDNRLIKWVHADNLTELFGVSFWIRPDFLRSESMDNIDSILGELSDRLDYIKYNDSPFLPLLPKKISQIVNVFRERYMLQS